MKVIINGGIEAGLLNAVKKDFQEGRGPDLTPAEETRLAFLNGLPKGRPVFLNPAGEQISREQVKENFKNKTHA